MRGRLLGSLQRFTRGRFGSLRRLTGRFLGLRGRLACFGQARLDSVARLVAAASSLSSVAIFSVTSPEAASRPDRSWSSSAILGGQ